MSVSKQLTLTAPPTPHLHHHQQQHDTEESWKWSWPISTVQKRQKWLQVRRNFVKRCRAQRQCRCNFTNTLCARHTSLERETTFSDGAAQQRDRAAPALLAAHSPVSDLWRQLLIWGPENAQQLQLQPTVIIIRIRIRIIWSSAQHVSSLSWTPPSASFLLSSLMRRDGAPAW